MKKIPTVFVRDFENKPRLVTREVTPGCEWVLEGEGVATRKWDGTAVLIEDGKAFKRRMVRADKPTPPDFVEVDADEETGKKFGWVPVTDDPNDKYVHAALALEPGLPDGTFELCGPHVQGNPEGWNEDQLVPHGTFELGEPGKRTFDSIREQLEQWDVEGIVYWRDGKPAAKIKKRDFGLLRKAKR